MSLTMFRDVGPYEIIRQIGRGMSPVFLATDSRSGASVALKVVPVGTDDDAREILDAEQQGADLQRRFSELTDYVPRVYEVGMASEYFFIAMEYIQGEDLSTVLSKGPLAPARAIQIAIQLCRFLEEVDRVAGAEGESVQTLLHNDLKPRNIRLEPGDRVKILDFGAAKVLSLSKRVTRNVFGSIPYLSPECLETGKRDRYTDAWALGVLLYEMVAGRLPFHGDDTVSLEHRIRSRQSAVTPRGIPENLGFVIARLLAPYPEDRYESASAIRADLERVAEGVESWAESQSSSPRLVDEPATRRTRHPLEADPPTRATPKLSSGSPAEPVGAIADVPTRPMATASAAAPDPGKVVSAEVVAEPASARKPSRFRRMAGMAAFLIVLAVTANEACISRQSHRLAASVPLQEFAGLNNAWTQYESLAGRSFLAGMGVREVERAIRRQSQVLADRVIANYRGPTPTVRESQWAAAATALRRALTIAPGDDDMRAALRYSEGHLHRINGQARKERGEDAQAQRELAEAISAFREAAALRPEWPDPFLGLARTFIYGVEDIDRGAEALNEAERLGYALGARETAQLGDGYRVRGETLQRAATELVGLPQERESLTRAAEAYKRALELYSKVADFGDVAATIRMTQNRLAVVERKLDEASPAGGALGRWLSDLIKGQ